ncbi:MAG: hypothetical protein AB1736_06525 [Chloroflexota bacterium]
MTDGDTGAPPSSPARRSRLRLVLAVALVLAGLVWTLQGAGILTAGRSFMIGDPTWVVIGLATMGVGSLVALREVPRR